MNYFELQQKAREYPLFKTEDVMKWFPESKRGNTANQLSAWVKKDRLERITRGQYLMPGNTGCDLFVLANMLYGPSYISLESALNAYGMIPDIPLSTVSVTMPTTKVFRTRRHGVFYYHHIRPELFHSFRIVRINSPPFEHYEYRIATPEKALFDYFYFRSGGVKNPQGFIHELRLTLSEAFQVRAILTWGALVSQNRRAFHAVLDAFSTMHHDK